MPRNFLFLPRFLPFILRQAEGEGAGPATGAPDPTPAAPSTEGAPTSLLGNHAPAPAPDAPAADGPPTTEAPEAPAPFEFSSLTLPEGFAADEEVSAAFTALLNDQELSRADLAQKMVDLYAVESGKAAQAALAAGVKEMATEWTRTNTEWQTAVAALPEFAGKVEAELGKVRQALTAQGAPKEFFDALSITGAGNNPHILQMLHKLTSPYMEGGGVSGQAKPTQQSRASSIYPTMAGGN